MSDQSDEATPQDLAGIEPDSPIEKESKFRALRIWPAIFFVIVMWTLRCIPMFSPDELTTTILMASFMGPMACSGFIVLIWWPFFSRASMKEKLVGLAGILVILVATTAIADQTVQNLGTPLYAIPWGATAFAVAACIFGAQKSTRRTWIALLAAFIVFGYWDLVRIDDIRGGFSKQYNWRWEPSLEDVAREKIAKRKQAEAREPVDERDDAETLPEPEWPEFRGPGRRGVQPGIALAEDWEKEPLEELWRIPIGVGWSSFSVAGDLVYTQEQRDDKEAVVCFEASTGDTVWSHEYESRFWEVIGGPGPRATPTLVGERLYALGGEGILKCLDRFTGDEIWSADIRDEAKRQPPTWGFASSPLVTHGLVIVHAGGQEDNGVLAYDAETGKFEWSVGSGDHSYSSPQLNTIHGEEYVLMLTNSGLSVIDPGKGKLLADHLFPFEGYRVVQPLVFAENSILLGTPMGSGTQRILLQPKNDSVSIKETWVTKRMSPYYNDFVVHKGHLYGFDNAIFACVELEEGSRKWKRGRYGHGQVLLLPEKDQLLIISEDGELVLLRATPDGHEELTRTRVLDGRTWNHPVVVGDRLYVRNAEEAACFQVPLQNTNGNDEPQTEVSVD